MAQDAAQEAFVEAFSCLNQLQEDHAFGAWMRCIVFKHCDRITRKKQLTTVSLSSEHEQISCDHSTVEAVERKECDGRVREAVAALPDHERVVIVLFYMGEHSQRHIAEFLEVPLTTVKKRLFNARRKLKKTMIPMIQENLEKHAPSNDSEFVQRIKATAQRIAMKYQYEHPPTPGANTQQEFAARLRLQIGRVEATLEVADQDATGWFGSPQDCLSVCGNAAHLARHNQLLWLDMVAAGVSQDTLPAELHHKRPENMARTWEFLLERERDSPQQVVTRLKAVNEAIALAIELSSSQEMNQPIATLLYNEQSLWSLMLIIIEQGSFCQGQAWGILKLKRYGAFSWNERVEEPTS